MLKNTLHHYYPGSTTLTGSTGSIGSDGNGMSADDPERVIKRLYRELTDLKVRNEFLEQSLQDSNNGLLSDGKLLNDIQQLQSKVESQQHIIDSQNEMLDEAQSLLQQLKEERDSLRNRLHGTNLEEENNSLRKEIEELEKHLLSANDQIAYLSQQTFLPPVPEVSDEETDYSLLQEEVQSCLSWILKMEDVLHLQNADASIQNRMEAIYNKLPTKSSVMENSYLALIQSEINELYLLIEGSKTEPSPIRQLHTLQDAVRSIVANQHVSSFKDIKAGCDVDWNELYKALFQDTENAVIPSKTEFLAEGKQLVLRMKKKEEEMIGMLESLKQECSESLRLNQDLYRECQEAKNTITSQKQQVNKYMEKVKKHHALKEKLKLAIEEIKSRGMLIAQYQQLLVEHGISC